MDYSAEVIKGSEWLHKAEDRFTADENKDYDPREAVVVYRENGGTLTDTLKVSQAEATFFSISKHTAELGQEGGSVEVEAKSNLEYEVIIPADAPWITEITSKGLASKAHTFAVAANETYMAREATIQFRVKDGSQTETLKTTQAQKDGFISETGDVSFTAEGGIAEIKVLSNVGLAFAVPESAAWLSKEAQSSTDREDGLTEYVIKVKASENESVASRSAILSCSSADGSRAFTVGASQAAAAAFLALNTEPAVSIGADGGNVNVGFSTNGTYSIEIPATAYWIAEGARRADGKAHTQALTIDPNESVFVRTATVTFRSIEDQGLSFKVAVTQSGEDVKLALVSDSEIDVPAAGGNYNVTISTNSDYSLDNTSKADWVTPGDISSEGENVTQTFTIAENASITDRTATVTYTSNTNKSLSAAITFVQKGDDIYLTRTSAATASLGKEGGNVSVTFKTNAGYSVSIPSDAGWLSTGNKSNSGDVHTQMLTVAANAAISTRTATGTFTCTDAPALSFDVAIVQTGEDIYLTRSSESAISFTSAGGSSTVTLMSNADYSISMSSAAAAWITAGEKTHSGANYTQPLAVSANTTIYERSATLTFTSDADPTLSFTVSIVQRGEDIYLTRTSAASISFNEAGGSYNVTLSSNADYKVSI
ncbi:MAG: BACON domain-containing carbohydrate-binding protein, partial [Bacteroidales bacterium]